MEAYHGTILFLINPYFLNSAFIFEKSHEFVGHIVKPRDIFDKNTVFSLSFRTRLHLCLDFIGISLMVALRM